MFFSLFQIRHCSFHFSILTMSFLLLHTDNVLFTISYSTLFFSLFHTEPDSILFSLFRTRHHSFHYSILTLFILLFPCLFRCSSLTLFFSLFQTNTVVFSLHYFKLTLFQARHCSTQYSGLTLFYSLCLIHE